VDLVNKAPMISGSVLEDIHYQKGEDKFTHIHNNTDWKTGLEHGEKIGIGKLDYELIIV